MSYVQKVNHRGKEVILFDCAAKEKEVVFKVIEEGKQEVAKYPPKTALALTDVTGLRFNTDISDAFREFAAHNKPFIRASALVGITGLQKIAYQTIMTLTGRNIPIFSTRQEALDWLIAQ